MKDNAPSAVIEVKPLLQDAFVLRCDRGGMAFEPGQHVNLGLAGAGINREYSIYSGTNDPYLEFLVKIHPGSDSALALAVARPGDLVDVAGPYGAFTLPREVTVDRRPVWLLAGGVGIAPFHSMIRSLPSLDYHLVHGVRASTAAYARSDYDAARCTLCCSQSDDGDFRGRITDWLQEHPLPPDATAFLCGSSGMVADTYECLRRQGLPSNQLVAEVFFQ